MRLACGWWLSVGALALSGCFDPGSPVMPETDATGSTGPDPTASTGGTNPNPTATDPDPDTGSSDTVDPPTETDPDTTIGMPECVGEALDPTCPPEMPYCNMGTCRDCTGLLEGACMNFDPSTPTCDADTGLCAPCTEHDQCVTGACRFTTGECFAESNRLWVDNTFGGCAGGVGTEDNPFCNVVDAMEVINMQAGDEPWAIFVAGSPNTYDGTIDPDNNRPVAIIGPSSGLAATLFNDNGYTLDLWAQSPETYLDHVTVDRNFGGPTIRCNTGQVYVTDSNLLGGEVVADVTGCSLRTRRVNMMSFGRCVDVGSSGEFLAEQTILDNSSGGMIVEGTAVLRRSVVSNHYVEGGISVQGGDLTLVNSMVFNNQYVNDGVMVTQGGNAEVVHSTIVGDFGCGNNINASIRNSIVLGVSCTTATVDNSVVTMGAAGQGMGNVVAGPGDFGSIFVNGGGQSPDDWHVLPGSLPEGVAVHQAGDPVVDFDGEPRPIMAGAADYAGADVP